jgi:hypothetical protein
MAGWWEAWVPLVVGGVALWPRTTWTVLSLKIRLQAQYRRASVMLSLEVGPRSQDPWPAAGEEPRA